jgi:nicotinamide-nucleotide amidase
MTTQHISQLVEKLAQQLTTKKLKLSTAESCTGGGLAFYLTNLSGSSDWFDCGFVTYSNFSKQKLLNVKSDTLKKFGAVSEETAREMAEGAIKQSQANVSMAITGIAGPAGGTKEKPVGLVWFAWTMNQKTQAEKKIFSGTRETIREQAIDFAMTKLLEI